MHRALTILEVLTEIYLFLDSEENPACFIALCSLARTCRTFSEPALDVIWNTISDVEVLLQTMPSYIGTNSSRRGHFAGELTEADWAAFTKHARRIGSLDLTASSDDDISSSVFRTLAQCKAGLILFPRLRDLRFDPTKFSPRLATIFIGPNLATVRMEPYGLRYEPMPPDSPAIISEIRVFLEALCAYTPKPRLQTLTVAYVAIGPELLYRTGSALPTLKNLLLMFTPEFAHDVDATSKALGKLFSLKNLNGVQILFHPLTKMVRIPASIEPGCALERLCLHGRIATNTLFLSAYKPAPRELNIFSIFYEHQDVWDALLSAVYSCSPTTLRRFTIAPFMTDEDVSDTDLSCGILARMPTFPSMVTLSIRLPFDLTDAIIEHIAHACPALVVLHMTVDSPRARRPITSVKVLSTLIRNCPHLEDLGIPIDPAQPYTLDGSTIKSTSPGVRQLLMEPWPMSYMQHVEGFAIDVDTLFPALKTCGLATDAAEDELPIETVVQALRKLQIARGCPEADAVITYVEETFEI